MGIEAKKRRNRNRKKKANHGNVGSEDHSKGETQGEVLKQSFHIPQHSEASGSVEGATERDRSVKQTHQEHKDSSKCRSERKKYSEKWREEQKAKALKAKKAKALAEKKEKVKVKDKEGSLGQEVKPFGESQTTKEVKNENTPKAVKSKKEAVAFAMSVKKPAATELPHTSKQELRHILKAKRNLSETVDTKELLLTTGSTEKDKTFESSIKHQASVDTEKSLEEEKHLRKRERRQRKRKEKVKENLKLSPGETTTERQDVKTDLGSMEKETEDSLKEREVGARGWEPVEARNQMHQVSDTGAGEGGESTRQTPIPAIPLIPNVPQPLLLGAPLSMVAQGMPFLLNQYPVPLGVHPGQGVLGVGPGLAVPMSGPLSPQHWIPQPQFERNFSPGRSSSPGSTVSSKSLSRDSSIDRVQGLGGVPDQSVWVRNDLSSHVSPSNDSRPSTPMGAATSSEKKKSAWGATGSLESPADDRSKSKGEDSTDFPSLNQKLSKKQLKELQEKVPQESPDKQKATNSMNKTPAKSNRRNYIPFDVQNTFTSTPVRASHGAAGQSVQRLPSGNMKHMANAIAAQCIKRIAKAGELVTPEAVVKMVLNQLQVNSLKELGLRREADLLCLHELIMTQSKLNAFFHAYELVQAIGTLHDLQRNLPKIFDKTSFSELLLGPLTKQPKIYELFSFPSDKDEIPSITATDLLRHLREFLNRNRDYSKRVKLEDFVLYLKEEYAVENPYELGVRIKSIGLGISVSSLCFYFSYFTQ